MKLRLGKVQVHDSLHIAPRRVASISPRSGSVRAGSSRQDEGGVEYPLTRVVNNPKYDSGRTDYDVAVLEIQGTFQLGETMKVIPLPAAGEDLPGGAILQVSGWGLTQVQYRSNQARHIQKQMTVVMSLPIF